MKRILLVALTVALALGLAATAYAGELQLGGKEAGVDATYDSGAFAESNIWIKIGSVDFVDGSFKFHLTDMKINFKPKYIKGGTPGGGTNAQDISLNFDYGKWYAETGGDGIVFTFSNDRGKWVPYFGFLKPTAKVRDDDPHRVYYLVTGAGTVAGLDVAFNAYECQNGRKDISLTASKVLNDVRVSGFIGDFDGIDYYGGDVIVSNLLGAGKLQGGIYANTDGPTGNGLAYRFGVAGVAVGPAKVDAEYRFGNENVLQSSSWKDGNIPGANTKEFYTKAEVPVDLFEMPMTLTGEFTANLAASNNTIKLSDKFNMSDAVKDVVLSAEFGTAVAQPVYAAEVTIVPGLEGLELYPRVENRPGAATPFTFLAGAKYAFDSTTLLGGVIYKGGWDTYFAYGDSTAAFGTLDTRIAGLYLKKTANTYKRAYAKATTNLNEYLTDIGVQFLYRQDNTAAAKISAGFGGKYAVSADTTLSASYIFRDWSTNHLFIELKKTVGSATFTLSYGDNDDYKDENDNGDIHELTHKKFLKKDGLPWKSFQGDDGAVQNRIKAGVVVKW
jgi:hypothetical protein